MKNFAEGTIIRCDFNNNLTVELENHDLVYVPYEEVRKYQAEDADFTYMVGKTIKLLPTESVNDFGMPIYSHKAYEIAELDEMKRDLAEKRRNTYWAKLHSILPNGQLAFYRIEGTDISGAVPLHDFCFNRLHSFHDCIMPVRIQVAVREFCENGHVKMCAIPGFWGFDESIDRLNVYPGNLLEGEVTSIIPKTGVSVVCLAPNLVTLVDGAPYGSRVRIKIKSVDRDLHRVKACLAEDGIIETNCVKPFDYTRFVETESLPAFVDLATYRKENQLSKKQASAQSEPILHSQEPVEKPSFDFKAEFSPFSMNGFINERVVYDAPGYGTVSAIQTAVQRGDLTEEHRFFASLFLKLRFATKFQLVRTAYLLEGKLYDENRVGKILEKLYAMNILGRLHFRSDGRVDEPSDTPITTKFHVYYPGRNYLGFMGCRVPYCSLYQTTTENPGVSKTRLSLNQLLLGMLNCYQDRDSRFEASKRIFFEDREHLTVSYQLTVGEERFYLESIRSNWHEESLDKLLRYDRYFKTTPHAHGTMYLTLENQEEIDAVEDKIKALGLSYTVVLTHDLAIFPTPEFIKVIEPSEDDLLDCMAG